MQLILQIAAGSGIGQRLTLRPGETAKIGRLPSNDWAFPDDPGVSGVHFALDFAAGQWRVRDLRSTNGTQVNGSYIARQALADGDKILAGQILFHVQLEPEPAHPVVSEVPSDVTARSQPVATVAVAKALDKVAATPAENDDTREVLVLNNDTPFVVGTLLGESTSGQAYVTVVFKATFTVDAKGAVMPAAEQLPLFEADIPEDPKDPTSPLFFETDMVPFKPRTDVVLVGRACAPGRPLITELDVRVRVGALDRTIRVFGDRKWIFPTRLAVAPRISAPTPFRNMELSYRRAFGGIDAAAALYCPENLAGVGFAGGPTPESLHDRPLPNLEDPDHLITFWDSHPQPVGFGFYGRGWAPRLQFAGTYDEHYLKHRAPLPPEDFSLELYNGAHPLMQVDGYLKGGESVDIDNVHSDGPLRFQLPALRPRVTIARYVPRHSLTASSATSSTLSVSNVRVEPQIRPVLDTLVLIPNRRTFYEIFRCMIPIANLADIDVYRIEVCLKP